MNKAPNSQFTTRENYSFSSISLDQFNSIWNELFANYGLKNIHISEGAGYSMAMVVRYALGLSAKDGRVYALVQDCPAGWIALATIRHLVNGGSFAGVILCDDTENSSEEFKEQLTPLLKIGIPLKSFSNLSNLEITELLESCHNVISGLFSREGKFFPRMNELITLLNESKVPVHSIEAPLGLHCDTGLPNNNPLFASSTLSIGCPLKGLNPGAQFVGRHYVCDISIPPQLYQKYGENLSVLFESQPVVQIFPVEIPTIIS